MNEFAQTKFQCQSSSSSTVSCCCFYVSSLQARFSVERNCAVSPKIRDVYQHTGSYRLKASSDMLLVFNASQLRGPTIRAYSTERPTTTHHSNGRLTRAIQKLPPEAVLYSSRLAEMNQN
jgi:hypothetical protein